MTSQNNEESMAAKRVVRKSRLCDYEYCYQETRVIPEGTEGILLTLLGREQQYYHIGCYEKARIDTRIFGREAMVAVQDPKT